MEQLDLIYEVCYVCRSCEYFHAFRPLGEEVEEFPMGFMECSNHLEFDKMGKRITYAILRLNGVEVSREPDRQPLVRQSGSKILDHWYRN